MCKDESYPRLQEASFSRDKRRTVRRDEYDDSFRGFLLDFTLKTRPFKESEFLDLQVGAEVWVAY